MTYRKLLKNHGLRLKYDDPLKTSFAMKEYEDERWRKSVIWVQRKKGKFLIAVLGLGDWKKYFAKEARILANRLAEFGEVEVVIR